MFKRFLRRLFRRECVVICPVDGQTFTTRNGHTYCSLACKRAANAQSAA